LGRWSNALATAGQSPDLTASERSVRKDALVAYLEDVEAATSRLVRRLKRAGTPDVDDGEKVAATYRKGLTQARDGFADALDLADDVSTRSAARFDESAAEVTAMVSESANAVHDTFASASEKYDIPELRTAFANEPTCTGLI
jgi:hypothetical protein